jgi:death-on-curing protein
MHYLTVDEVIFIHDEMIRQFGGSHGLMSYERLESSVAAPRQAVFGEELYPDLASKAAVLFYLLIKNHCFVDGNKRTAAVALIEFLERNGQTLVATNDELYQFTMDVATSALTKGQITQWIQARMRPLETGDA